MQPFPIIPEHEQTATSRFQVSAGTFTVQVQVDRFSLSVGIGKKIIRYSLLINRMMLYEKPV